MITAEQARDLADNIQTPAAQALLSKLNTRISNAAIAGNSCLDITKEDDIPCVFNYLEHLGYKVETTKDKEYGKVVLRVVSWKEH